jgi:hypothetical protein
MRIAMRGKLLALGALLALSAGCKFEPIGATARGEDAAIDPADGGDAAVNPVDSGPGGDGAVRAAHTAYFPSAGGGEVSSSQHRATIIVGGSAAPLTSTSTVHRVQFGGAAR